MRSRSRAFATATSLALLLGCRDGATPPRPEAVFLEIWPSSLALDLGDSARFTASTVWSDGSRRPASGHWSSGDPLVRVDQTGWVTATALGHTTIELDADGFHALGIVYVRSARSPQAPQPPGAPTGDAELRVEKFDVLEFQYPIDSGQWEYAPQIRVSAPGQGITVLTVMLHIPGLDDSIPEIPCGGPVAAGASVELNGEAYGDWAWSVYESGRRATGAAVTAIITYRDGSGTGGSITVNGPVVPGGVPTTYGGDGGACFHSAAGV